MPQRNPVVRDGSRLWLGLDLRRETGEKYPMPELSLIRASAISLTVHLFFGVVSLFVGAVAIKAIDKFLLKQIDLEAEIARGNLAAAIMAGALWIALAMILTKG